MNRKGFTLVELIAVIVLLGIIVGITVITVNGGFGRAKDKTEEVFISTIEDALEVYLDTDAKTLSENTNVGIIRKTHGDIALYKIGTVSFNDVINSSMRPIAESDFVNPANKEGDCKGNLNGNIIEIYRDDDYVYYYKFDKSALGSNCLKNTDGVISNLPKYESK